MVFKSTRARKINLEKKLSGARKNKISEVYGKGKINIHITYTQTIYKLYN